MACKFGYKCCHEDSDLCKRCNVDRIFEAIARNPFSLRRNYG